MTENEGFRFVGEISLAIAEQLLSSYEWGSVPFRTDVARVSSKGDFSQRVADMWAQDYQWIPFWAFGPAFGTYDAWYAGIFRDHHLRAILPTVVAHTRLAFIGDGTNRMGLDGGASFLGLPQCRAGLLAGGPGGADKRGHLGHPAERGTPHGHDPPPALSHSQCARRNGSVTLHPHDAMASQR